MNHTEIGSARSNPPRAAERSFVEHADLLE